MRIRFARRHPVLTTLAVSLLCLVVIRAVAVESFAVPSESMEPLLRPGDRILVSRFERGPSIQRGDVVVFDGTAAFGPTPSTGSVLDRATDVLDSLLGAGGGNDYVKRVIGVPGDRVTCCDVDGRVTVNGVALSEPYLYPGDSPSELRFDVVVPANRVWVMGDHRSDSSDSRARLGQPGGGMVAVDDVVGRVWVRYWPPGRVGSVPGSGSLSALPATSRAGH